MKKRIIEHGKFRATNSEPHDRRTALLIRCRYDEAELIRNAAQQERRTISGFILNSVLQRIAIRQNIRARLNKKRKS